MIKKIVALLGITIFSLFANNTEDSTSVIKEVSTTKRGNDSILEITSPRVLNENISKNRYYLLNGNVDSLSIESMLEKYVQKSLSVATAEAEWEISQRRKKAAWSAYGPAVVSGFEKTVATREYSLKNDTNSTFNMGVENKILTGGKVDLTFSLRDVRIRTGISDKPKATRSIGITQPLLKGAWFGAPWGDIRISAIDENIAWQNYRKALMNIMFEGEAAYWNLAFAQQKYRYAQESVKIAEELVADSKIRVRTGKMSPTELIEAKAGLASRLNSLSRSKQELLNAMARLKTLLGNKEIRDEAMLFATTAISVPDSLSQLIQDTINGTFYEKIPDYRIKEYEVKKGKTIVNYRRDQCLPELNAKFSYGVFAEARNSKLALEKLNDEGKRQITWTSGLYLKIPFTVESINLLKMEKMKYSMSQMKLSSVKYELTTMIHRLRSEAESVKSRRKNALEIVAYRKELLDAEFKKLNAGKSSYRVIFEAEEKLAEAKLWDLESMVDYREVIMKFQYFSGTILEIHGLEESATIQKGSNNILIRFFNRIKSIFIGE